MLLLGHAKSRCTAHKNRAWGKNTTFLQMARKNHFGFSDCGKIAILMKWFDVSLLTHMQSMEPTRRQLFYSRPDGRDSRRALLVISLAIGIMLAGSRTLQTTSIPQHIEQYDS
jgi:hypothetical protein